jgi:3-dehydroquinate synthase class II
VLLGDGGAQRIEDLKSGDKVLSRDEDGRETAARRVTRCWVHKVPETLSLHLSNGETIQTTRQHRFAVAEKGFMSVANLVAGDRLIANDGAQLAIMRIDLHRQPATVYNLSVEEFRTYFVGQAGVWVHNFKDPYVP